MVSVAVLPGDGVGAEVLAGPIEILHELQGRGLIKISGPWPVGTSAYKEHGTVLPADTLAACEAADAILLGAIGEHPGAPAAAYTERSALSTLRSHFDLRISIREVLRGGAEPLLIVRNLRGGAYGPDEHRQIETERAADRIELTGARIAEVVRVGAQLAMTIPGHALVSVDKANLLATSQLWRATAESIANGLGVELRSVYVDRMAFELARDLPPAVIITEGLFGDILSDVAAARAGSIARCSSLSVQPDGPTTGRCAALFEPTHGSAPRRAGQNIVNPTGAYLALAGLLDRVGLARECAALRHSLQRVNDDGIRTYDLAGTGATAASTSAFSEAVNQRFARACRPRADVREPGERRVARHV